jgi:hypothetical protein
MPKRPKTFKTKLQNIAANGYFVFNFAVFYLSASALSTAESLAKAQVTEPSRWLLPAGLLLVCSLLSGLVVYIEFSKFGPYARRHSVTDSIASA